MPIALAILITFVLTPPVTWLERWTGRVPAALAGAILVCGRGGRLSGRVVVVPGVLDVALGATGLLVHSTAPAVEAVPD